MILANTGRAISLETRAKMSRAKLGKRLSAEHCRKLSDARKGRICSLAHRKAISEGSRGKTLSAETRKLLSEISKRRQVSEKEKCRLRTLAIGRVVSEETRNKLRIASTSRHHTEATRRLISEKKRGHRLSDEQRLLRRQKWWLNKHKRSNVSLTERTWGDKIESVFGVTLDRSVWIDGRCFDFMFKGCLIEIDGVYWHSLPGRQAIDSLKNDIAIRNNFNIYRFSIDRMKEVDASIVKHFDILCNIFGTERRLI